MLPPAPVSEKGREADGTDVQGRPRGALYTAPARGNQSYQPSEMTPYPNPNTEFPDKIVPPPSQVLRKFQERRFVPTSVGTASPGWDGRVGAGDGRDGGLVPK